MPRHIVDRGRKDKHAVKHFALLLTCMALLLAPDLIQPINVKHATAASSVLAGNLIVNGDAEGSSGVTNDTSVLAPAGWKVSAKFTVVQYGASGDFPTLTDPGPTTRGKNLFAGGPDNARSSATQQITLPATVVVTKRHKYYYELSGYFGGYASDTGYAALSIRFISGTGQRLGSRRIGGVTPQDRKDQTGLLPRGVDGTVPLGTRSIDVVLTMYSEQGSYNDGFADNLSLTLSPVKRVYRAAGSPGG
jgi:hypothetical protein